VHLACLFRLKDKASQTSPVDEATAPPAAMKMHGVGAPCACIQAELEGASQTAESLAGLAQPCSAYAPQPHLVADSGPFIRI
jgi:hypothetical protein